MAGETGLAAVMFGARKRWTAVSPGCLSRVISWKLIGLGRTRQFIRAFETHATPCAAFLPAGSSGVSMKSTCTLLADCFRLKAVVHQRLLLGGSVSDANTANSSRVYRKQPTGRW